MMTESAEPKLQRYLKGGTAQFGAGYETLRFDLSPNVRITSDIFVKADANTVLISSHPHAKYTTQRLEAFLKDVGGRLRFFHQTNLSQRKRWNATIIAGFYEPEHAQAVMTTLNGTPHVKAQILYTVYFTGPKKFTDAVAVEAQLITSRFDADLVSETPRDGKVTLRLSGVRKETVAKMKHRLEVIFSGRIATVPAKGNFQSACSELWHDFFDTAYGKIWLQQLSRSISNIFITIDKPQQRIRIYTSKDDYAGVRLFERALVDKIYKLGVPEQTHTFEFDGEAFKSFFKSSTISKAQEQIGQAKVGINISKRTMTLHCGPEYAQQIADALVLRSIRATTRASIWPDSRCSQCGVTTLDIRFSKCKHVLCKGCFDYQLHVAATDLSHAYFPLVCWVEGCQQAMCISDLRRYTAETKIEALLEAALTYHIRSYPELYRNCPTPDCGSVYQCSGSYEISMCPTCLTQTCTLCHAEPHIGWTCAEYNAQPNNNREGQPLANYTSMTGTKACPKCATLIDKIEGCDHIECSICHTHICWVCLEIYANAHAVYLHIDAAHTRHMLPEEMEGS
jgi:hypothetical protein